VALAGALSACGTTSVSPPPPPVQPLSVTCPANVTATAPVGMTAIPVTYDAPTITGGTPPVSVACVPASGATFPLGTTAVNCTATDAIGRTAVCPTPTSIVVKSHTIGLTNIVAFGDSITAGENGLSGQPAFVAPPTCPEPLPDASALRIQSAARPQSIDLPNSYPTLLLNMLTANFTQAITMDNRGWPGEATGQGVTRLSCVLAVDHPDTLLLLEGINTLAQGDFSQTAIAQTVNDLRTDIQNAHAAGVSFIFVGTLLPTGNCDPTHSTCNGTKSDIPSINAANDGIRSMVSSQSSLGATLVDLNAAYNSADAPNFFTLIGPDGLHPTPSGNTLTARTFFSAILAKVTVTSIRRVHR
jgi:lysophospholipase L1-like esterase